MSLKIKSLLVKKKKKKKEEAMSRKAKKRKEEPMLPIKQSCTGMIYRPNPLALRFPRTISPIAGSGPH